ncbi:DUF6596 domain-containing protein [Streptomyces albus subsp. chlorinus]|uniref:DUF6596 domain-containing protein n=1 Tax=Streptomyces albus TaxID=1888 RepID=UPI00156FFF71
MKFLISVHYLIFNEGCTASSGRDLHRPDLAREAIRLTRTVHAQLPADDEVTGLLALMLLDPRPPGGPDHGFKAPAGARRRAGPSPGSGPSSCSER